MLIDDFSDGLASGWRVFTDQVMGGVSTGSAKVEDGALHLTGTVSTANNGGFVQARLDLTDNLPANTMALRIRVRGDGQRYFLHVRTTETRRPWHYYQAAFDTSGTWEEIDLPLTAFRPSRQLQTSTPAQGQITSIALVAYGRDHEADIRLSRVEAR